MLRILFLILGCQLTPICLLTINTMGQDLVEQLNNGVPFLTNEEILIVKRIETEQLIAACENRDTSSPLKRKLLSAIGVKRENPRLVLPFLMKYIADDDFGVAYAACETVAIYNPECLPYLKQLSSSKDHRLRLGAVNVIGLIKDTDIQTEGLLSRFIGDEDTFVNRDALTYFRNYKSVSASTLSKIQNELNSADGKTRATAAFAYTCLGGANQKSTEVLLATLKYPEESYVHEAVIALGMSRTNDVKLVAALREAFNRKDVNVKGAVIEALWEITNSQDIVEPLILDVLLHGDDLNRLAAYKIIPKVKISASVKSAIQELVKQTNSQINGMFKKLFRQQNRWAQCGSGSRPRL